MDPPLRRYLEFALSRSARDDFLRATEVDATDFDLGLLSKEHYVWETAVWACVSGRKLIRRADGTSRLVRPSEVTPTDKVLINELRPCSMSVRDDGVYSIEVTSQVSNKAIYYRGDPRESEAALRDALPALYRSFRAR
jgi:hypothetical protein